MKRVLKTLLLSVLIFTMAMPTSLMASDQKLDKTDSKHRVVEGKVSENLLDSDLNAEDDVRVIVEMKDIPVISYAIDQGVGVVDLGDNFVQSRAEAMIEVQDEVIADIESTDSEMEIHQQFTTVFNGFSATIKYGEIDSIASQKM